jgi:hypothetical protein
MAWLMPRAVPVALGLFLQAARGDDRVGVQAYTPSAWRPSTGPPSNGTSSRSWHGWARTPPRAGPPASPSPDEHARGGARRYVAMGSSFAAGPASRHAPGQPAPRRPAGNYAHLVARALGLDLHDVTFPVRPPATSWPVRCRPGRSARRRNARNQPVTITAGGNDVPAVSPAGIAIYYGATLIGGGSIGWMRPAALQGTFQRFLS